MIENKKFKVDLMLAIHNNGIDNEMNLADHIIMRYILDCLGTLDRTIRRGLEDLDDYRREMDFDGGIPKEISKGSCINSMRCYYKKAKVNKSLSGKKSENNS